MKKLFSQPTLVLRYLKPHAHSNPHFNRTGDSWYWSVSIALMVILMGCTNPSQRIWQGEATSTLPVILKGQAVARIVISTNASEVIGNAAATLQQEIARRTGVAPPIVRGQQGPTSGMTTLYLGVTDHFSSMNQALIALGRQSVTTTKPGREGFQLHSGKIREAGVVVVNGCDELGVFHGVGWLLRRMDFTKAGASCTNGLDLATAPATAMRRIRFGDHLGYVNTPLDGWREIWSDYLLWGLSAVTFRCDPAHQGDPRETKLAQTLWNMWTERVPLARSLGLEVVHLTQSNLAFKDGEFGPQRVSNFQELNYMCPDFNGVNPKFARGRQLLWDSRKWFFDQMPHIGDVNYHLTSGWDGGGCTDPAVAPWSITYANLVDSIIYPLLKPHNPNAKIILALYQVPQVEELATKLSQGWRPDWLYALEFDEWQVDKARLFPPAYKRFYFPLWQTFGETYGFQDFGALPMPGFCQNNFRSIWDTNGIRDGLGCYSEGTHDYMNQIMLMQLAWSPQRTADSILEELCRYYFGPEAAPIVKQIMILMEQEHIRDLSNPQINPAIQGMVVQAEQLMPQWARVSRQWAMIVGRADIDRTRRRQADLFASYDDFWRRYQLLSQGQAGPVSTQWLKETSSYFVELAQNGWEMNKINQQLENSAFRVQGGRQLAEWSDFRTGDAVEAMEPLRDWDGSKPATVPGRWCMAFVGVDGNVNLMDGWGNTVLSNQKAADAMLAMADVFGDGSNRVIYLGQDGKLHAWEPRSGTDARLAEDNLMTGPLATGDLDGDGREEVLALAGQTFETATLAVVSADHRIRSLGIHPGGTPTERAAQGVYLEPLSMERAVRGERQPRVVICDLLGDGRQDIVCTDRDNGERLVILPDGNPAQKQVGPQAVGGVLAAGDLNGDGRPEIVYLNSKRQFTAYSPSAGVLNFEEAATPQWPIAVVAQLGGEDKPGVIYVDTAGYLRLIHPKGASRRLSELNSTAAMAPGLVVGDFDGDGRTNVAYLRRRMMFQYPLVDLSFVDGAGNFRDIPPTGPHLFGGKTYYWAPFGPRASGRIRLQSKTILPTVTNAMHHR